MQFHLSRTACVFHKLGKRQKDKRIILETISISHYVEKVCHLKIILEATKRNLCWQSKIQVRWAMDYMNIPYEEEENSGILGILTLGRSVPQLKVTNTPKQHQRHGKGVKMHQLYPRFHKLTS